jgi:hypothetical protein
MTAADTPPGRPRSPFLTGLAVGALLVAFSIAAFQLLGSDDTGDAATTTTTTAPDSTTGGDTDTTMTTDTTAPDSTTTTTAVVTPPDPYTAVGDPIPIEELQLTTNGVGPITFGTPAAEAAGRLIASLGEPDADSGPVVSTGAYGTCPGVTERIVRWGPLAAIMRIDDAGAATFAGYRLDLSYGGLSSPATELATFSGLQASDTVAELNEIYSGLQIDFLVAPPLGEVFELRGEDGALLLWGPVTSSQDDGIVLGIYAPDACRG